MRPVYYVLLAFTLVAQQVPQNPPPGPADAAKFQSSTQLVVEMVTVKDKSGKIVEGLAARDFTVTEDGKPQTIVFCEFQRLQDTQVAAQAAPQNAPAPAAAAS